MSQNAAENSLGAKNEVFLQPIRLLSVTIAMVYINMENVNMENVFSQMINYIII